MEETAVVPPPVTHVERLVPHLKQCGYGDAHLVRGFQVDRTTIDVAAFAGRPWDNWSACLAAVILDGDSKASAAKAQYLGAASVFVCGPQSVDWYGLGPNGPTEPRKSPWSDVPGLFREHKHELSPTAIYQAKLRRAAPQGRQMWFFDAGLMPAVEKNRGETLLRLVESAIEDLHSSLGSRLDTRQAQEDVYRTVFWQLAAKILHDKDVPKFQRIDLEDVDQVFERIGRHHGVTDRFPPFDKSGRPAINAMAASIAACGSLRDVSSESIAYVYENALLDKAAGKGKAKKAGKAYDIRKELGIHSTPSVLIQHMLSQVWNMVEEIKPDDRVVFEPACGHAPFLTAAMRWLRNWDESGQSNTDHTYMRKHLRGIEADTFAIELAKLALTLADEPHGNSWAIAQGDMFDPDMLAKEAKKARILLSNPPYEAFTEPLRDHYKAQGEEVTANTKAVEMLKRTLLHLPPGGVFGVVMPAGVLHDKESRDVRERLLNEFDLSEISVFADNLFEHGDHEVAVLMGRRKKPRAKPPALMYRRVREGGMAAFKERLAFSWEREVPQSRFVSVEDRDLRVPELDEVWAYLAASPVLLDYATIAKGLDFKGKTLPDGCWTVRDATDASGVPGFTKVDADLRIYKLPMIMKLNLERRAILSLRAGASTGKPQVLLNYGPVSRGPWKLKATLDEQGRALTSRFLAIRPKADGPSALYFWAVLNSPVANAFAYDMLGKRDILVGTMRKMPVPARSKDHEAAIEHAARDYREVAGRSVQTRSEKSDLFRPDVAGTTSLPTDSEVRDALLAMDAAVLRAYGLPVRLERQLLDLFNGAERKGVGCTFGDYYPAGFKSLVPLHKYISAGDRNSTIGQVAARMKPGSSQTVIAALRAATEAFGGDD